MVSVSTAAVNSNSTTAGFVTAFAGRGDGTFDFGTQVLVGVGPREMAIADFTGDGSPDIALTEYTEDKVRILRSVAPPPQPNGESCRQDTQCASTFCVDHTCCETLSCPTGQVCSAPGHTGQCHVPNPNGGECTDPAQCQSSFCVDGACCGTRTCPTGQFCNTGQCGPPSDPGTHCTDGTQCSLGFCVDRICCTTLSCPANQRCNTPGSEGACTATTDPGAPCADDAQCTSGFCTDGVCCLSKICPSGQVCNAAGYGGQCITAPTQTPTPTVTPTSTTTPTPQPNGASCSTGAQCESGNCLNSTCCSSASCPNDQRCDIINSPGACTAQKTLGDSCSKDTDCTTQNCDPNTVQCGLVRTATPTLTPTRTPTVTPTLTPKQGQGQTCDPNNPDACDSGLSCDPVSSVCCDTDNCLDPNRCDVFGSAGRCAPPLLKGDECARNTDCEDALICTFNPVSSRFECNVPPQPTPTLIPFTPKPTPPNGILIAVGSGQAGPGDTVSVAVSLAASGVSVAATSNDITFDSEVLTLSACAVNPSIGKTLTAGSVGAGTIRVFVQSHENASPIPDGPLYTCTFQVAAFALPATYPLRSGNVLAFSPAGAQLPNVAGADGFISISLVPQTCPGDCGGKGSVTIDDLITGVNIVLGNTPLAACFAFDRNGDGTVTVDELVMGVNSALNGCTTA